MAERGYRAVVDWIRAGVASGALRRGDRLPSEQALCQRFGLSRQTVRHATGLLEEQGLVTRVRGSGTYIGSAPAARREKRWNVALISTYVDDYIFPPTIRGIENVLAEAGYTTQVSFTDNRVDRETAVLQKLLDKDAIDGLIVEPAKSALPNPNLDCYRELSARGTPILFFNAKYPDLPFPCVRIDDRAAARSVTELLLAAGHRRIGGIFHAEDIQGRLRYQGWLEALRAAGIRECPAAWIDTAAVRDLRPLEAYLFRRLEGCTAALCYNDQAAHQMLELIRARGAALCVAGIDDAELARIDGFPTCAHPKELLGRKAAENLLRMMEDASFDGGFLFPACPVVRNACAEIPREDGAADKKERRT